MALLARCPLQFAAVREDPRIEERVLRELGAKRALLVGSAGCTALHLRATLPELNIELVDPNPAQLQLIDDKLAALMKFTPSRFNVGTDEPGGLHESGNFERLFRLFRTGLDLFVIDAPDRRGRFARDADWHDVIEHPYWPAAFASVFHDDLLVAMFGPDAVQHAEPGSYPGYFRSRIELGLRAEDRCVNPWLHHVLLGHYRDDPAAWPPYLRQRPEDLSPFAAYEGTLLDLPSFATFDFVQLSNVMDWMEEAACRELAGRLCRELQPNAGILWRQLNNSRDMKGYFGTEFSFDAQRDAAYVRDERSLFYNRVCFGIHR